jgi:hypothetical protein
MTSARSVNTQPKRVARTGDCRQAALSAVTRTRRPFDAEQRARVASDVEPSEVRRRGVVGDRRGVGVTTGGGGVGVTGGGT